MPDQKKQIICYARYIRELVETTLGQARKALRVGYYWPTLQKDAYNIVRACDKCQHFANVQTRPKETMTPISSPWPFAQWGIDIVGPFLLGKKQLRFLIVAFDYFTKWVRSRANDNDNRG